MAAGHLNVQNVWSSGAAVKELKAATALAEKITAHTLKFPLIDSRFWAGYNRNINAQRWRMAMREDLMLRL